MRGCDVVQLHVDFLFCSGRALRYARARSRMSDIAAHDSPMVIRGTPFLIGSPYAYIYMRRGMGVHSIYP
jgi:hypothetical protein